jgi:hypothetical protein
LKTEGKSCCQGARYPIDDVPCDLLPPARNPPPKVCKTSRDSATSWGPSIEHMRLWGTFHVDVITCKACTCHMPHACTHTHTHACSLSHTTNSSIHTVMYTHHNTQAPVYTYVHKHRLMHVLVDVCTAHTPLSAFRLELKCSLSGQQQRVMPADPPSPVPLGHSGTDLAWLCLH